MDVFMPLMNRLNRAPLANHAPHQLVPTELRPNVIPPEGQSFMGPVDVRQPLCPVRVVMGPVPDRVARPNDDVVDTVLISPGRQTIVFQGQVFDRYPIAALEAIMRDRTDRMHFDNLFRSPQKMASLPDWSALPRVEPIKDPPRRRPAYGHIQVPNDLPQPETKGRSYYQIDTGPTRSFAEIADVFEEFDDASRPDGGTEIELESSGGDPCGEQL